MAACAKTGVAAVSNRPAASTMVRYFLIAISPYMTEYSRAEDPRSQSAVSLSRSVVAAI